MKLKKDSFKSSNKHIKKKIQTCQKEFKPSNKHIKKKIEI